MWHVYSTCKIGRYGLNIRPSIVKPKLLKKDYVRLMVIDHFDYGIDRGSIVIELLNIQTQYPNRSFSFFGLKMRIRIAVKENNEL